MSSKPKHFEVVITRGAEHDIESIYDYIADSGGEARADHVLDRLMETVDELTQFPERGSHPKELAELGIREFRQTAFKPYRVIYRIIGAQVVIFLIVDGRRDMQSILSRRLLGG